MEHTPTPYYLDPKIQHSSPEIRGGQGRGRRVAKVLFDPGSEDREVNSNAAFIVRACNTHEKREKVLAHVAAELVSIHNDLAESPEKMQTILGDLRRLGSYVDAAILDNGEDDE